MGLQTGTSEVTEGLIEYNAGTMTGGLSKSPLGLNVLLMWDSSSQSRDRGAGCHVSVCDTWSDWKLSLKLQGSAVMLCDRATDTCQPALCEVWTGASPHTHPTLTHLEIHTYSTHQSSSRWQCYCSPQRGAFTDWRYSYMIYRAFILWIYGWTEDVRKAWIHRRRLSLLACCFHVLQQLSVVLLEVATVFWLKSPTIDPKFSPGEL